MFGRPQRRIARTLLAAVILPGLILGVAGPASAAAGKHGRAAAATGATGATGAPVVQTAQGAVQGVTSGAVRTFQGIPYAAPPVRWQPPTAPASWTGVRAADAPGNECVQSAVFWRPGSPASWHEDCLYLNVWTPAKMKRNLPVLVWFHGGGWVNGAATDVLPARLTAVGNVVVTVNYRLGAEGYLSLPGLDAESADGKSSGQYGDLDKIQALKWISQNIAAFGGDAGNVTIAGQSAGAGSVCWLMASPPAANLFDRAVVESIGDCGVLSHEDAATNGAAFATAIGCTDAATMVTCLRGKTPAEIIDAQAKSGVAWRPVVGGSAQPIAPTEAFSTGNFNHVPVIMGSNRHETRAFVYEGNDLMRQPLTAAAYEAQIRAKYGATADQVLAEYPVSAYDSAGLASAAVSTDTDFACPSVGVEDSLSKWVRTYAYEFRDETSPLRPYMVIPPSFPTGSMHSGEVPYIWESSIATPLTSTQLKLAAVMTKYWSRFAKSGTPNSNKLPTWPLYTTPDRLRLTFLEGGQTAVITGTEFSTEHHCAFWASMS
ncbi:MAG: lipase protein [Frankiales bacterium]|nr:lipase protein [Frankiales bacterium]